MGKTIGFDLDGVLYKWHELVYNHALFNFIIPSSVDYHEFWTNIDKYMNTTAQRNIVLDTSLYDKYSYDVSSKLVLFMNKINIDYDIIYVTSRPIEAQFTTYNWLKKNNFPCAEFLYFTEDKAKVCRAQRCMYFVEDQPKHGAKLKNVTNLYMVKQPWNEFCRDDYNFINNVFELEHILWSD